ncbi:MAG: beta strand repeat-containing protein, partial [Bacteroidota bacterium]
MNKLLSQITNWRARLLLLPILLVLLSMSSYGQVSTLQNFTNVYHGTSSSAQTSTVTMPAGTGTNRLMVVAVACSRQSTGSMSATITYGGRTLTSAVGDLNSTGIQQHTGIYYLKESDIDLASNSTLSVALSGGTVRINDVWVAIYDYVNQTSPIADSKNANSSSNSSSITFSSSLAINTGNQAILVVSSFRSNNTSTRTISSFPTNFTSVNQQTHTTGDAVRNAVANATIPTSNTTNAGTTSFSGNCWPSQSAITIAACSAPTVNAGATLAAICKGGTSAALGGSVGGSATGGTWSDGGVGGSFSPNATTLNATYTPPASFSGTITLTLTSSGGSCGSATASKTLTVNNPPSATISYANSSICSLVTASQSVTLTGTAGGTYSASPGGLTINSSTGAINAFTSLAGSYTVNYSVTSSGCGTVNATTNVNILQSPGNGVSGNLTACGSTTLTTSGGVSYLWSGGSSVTSPTNTFSSSGNYTLTITASNGCTSSATWPVVINPNPTNLTISSTLDSVCSPSSNFSLTASSNSNSSLSATILDENFNSATNNWTITNNSTLGTPALAAWTLTPNGYVYSGTTFNSNDATQFYLSNSDAQGSGSTTNTILESPSFSTAGLSSASLSYFNYYNDYDTKDSIRVLISTDGGTTWARIYLATTDAGTSTGFANQVISLNSYLGFSNVKIRFNYCAVWGYQWAIDNVKVTGTYTTPPAPSYAWSSSPLGFSSAIANPTNINQSVNTTYTVVATNSYGCTSSTSKTINNFSIGPKLSISDTTLCSPAEIMIGVSDSVQFASGYPTGTTVEWLGYAITGPIGTTLISSNSGTTFQAQVTIPSLGCVSNSNIINVNTRSIAMLPVIQPATCGLDNGKIKVTAVSPVFPPYRYIWRNSANVIIRDFTTNNISDSIMNLAAGDYTVDVYDNNGGAISCVSTTFNYTVGSAPAPVLNVTGTNISCNGQNDGTATITVTSGSAPYNYLWNAGTSSTTNSIFGLNDGTYTVTVTDTYGCSTEGSVTITTPTLISGNGITSPSCTNTNNGSISLSPSGGTGSKVVEWYDGNANLILSGANSISNIGSGTYYAIITDANNCQVTEEYYVGTIIVSPTNLTAANCDS